MVDYERFSHNLNLSYFQWCRVLTRSVCFVCDAWSRSLGCECKHVNIILAFGSRRTSVNLKFSALNVNE